MKSGVRVKRAAIATLAASTVAGAVLLGIAGPAAATATAAPASAPASHTVVRHPELDWAGSQVAKHEPHPTGTGGVTPLASTVAGLDVSSYQGSVDWSSVYSDGARFAYVKATEGTYYTNPDFNQQYEGSYNVGIIRGAYHFATPDTTSGAAQADYFVAHGGGWSKDGKTLPGMVDLEWDPYGADCYGLSQSAMVSWIKSFSNEYHAKTTRWPVIYTAQSWWSECTGNQGSFSANSPLALAYYSSTVGPMPYDWGYQTIWQYADSGTFPGDQDRFNGDISRVQALANG
jgi:GH25 family lysozyme M1 (1,4-beta-N-acetylmuramidase)